MKKKSRITLVLLFIAFIIANGLVYFATDFTKSQRINLVLNNSLKDLETQYEILLHNQKIIADATYINITKILPGFTNIMRSAQEAVGEQKKDLRDRLRRKLVNRYKVLRKEGVYQFQFVFPNNEVFLRMHETDKYGDNIGKIREDFRYTNKTHKGIRGFVQGEIGHAFRNVYPIFDRRHTYLGAMEVSFTSESLQKYLTGVSKIHTHFLVNKHIFNEQQWKRNDISLDYLESGEDKEYMLTLDSAHTRQKCVIEEKIRLKKVRDRITKSIANGEKFAVYALQDSHEVDVVAFIPIRDIAGKNVLAWMVSHSQSNFIYETIMATQLIRGVLFVTFVILFYLLYRLIMTKYKVEQEHQLVNDILDSTQDIIFATDFKTVNFSNRKFKEFFNVKSDSEFNKKVEKKVLDIFTPKSGYLHSGLLSDKESFSDLLFNVTEEKRVVSIFDASLVAKSFKINIIKTCYSQDGFFLITLHDAQKVKEQEQLIQQKATFDALTGMYNRKKFHELAEQELKRDSRYKHDLGVAIVGIDNIQDISEKFGAEIAKEVVVNIATRVATALRDTDIVARWDDEEFAILFPETSKEDLETICEKLRVEIEGITHREAGTVTASFGVTQYQDRDTLENIFERCNSALFEAKEAGRNRVCVK